MSHAYRSAQASQYQSNVVLAPAPAPKNGRPSTSASYSSESSSKSSSTPGSKSSSDNSTWSAPTEWTSPADAGSFPVTKGDERSAKIGVKLRRSFKELVNSPTRSDLGVGSPPLPSTSHLAVQTAPHILRKMRSEGIASKSTLRVPEVPLGPDSRYAAPRYGEPAPSPPLFAPPISRPDHVETEVKVLSPRHKHSFGSCRGKEFVEDEPAIPRRALRHAGPVIVGVQIDREVTAPTTFRSRRNVSHGPEQCPTAEADMSGLSAKERVIARNAHRQRSRTLTHAQSEEQRAYFTSSNSYSGH